jgi:Kef-type K+ transport system membrane component KefB
MTVLYCVAQLGLMLYMFVMGVGFDVGLLRQKAWSAVTVSAFGIVVPMALGAGLAWMWYGAFGLFTARASRGETMHFTGAARSITAFPMLARIIFERGMSGTAIGTLALAAGATDDALASCILAAVLASFTADVTVAARAVGADCSTRSSSWRARASARASPATSAPASTAKATATPRRWGRS